MGGVGGVGEGVGEGVGGVGVCVGEGALAVPSFTCSIPSSQRIFCFLSLFHRWSLPSPQII